MMKTFCDRCTTEIKSSGRHERSVEIPKTTGGYHYPQTYDLCLSCIDDVRVFVETKVPPVVCARTTT